MKAGIGERVLAASRTRDRVLDAVKAVALLLVIVGHSLAWHVRPDGTAVNVVEDVPYLIALTWLFQVLPLFFAAGAVSNAASLNRHGQMDYLRARGRSLLAPVVVYASLGPSCYWRSTAQSRCAGGTLPVAVAVVRRRYLLVAAAAVITTCWIPHPVLTLGLWLGAIAAFDALRTTDLAAWGWINMLLVWGWLHQCGYHLPQLKGPQVAGTCGGQH